MKPFLIAVWILTVTLATGQVKSNEASKENIPTLDQIKTEPINIRIHWEFRVSDMMLRIVLKYG